MIRRALPLAVLLALAGCGTMQSGGTHLVLAKSVVGADGAYIAFVKAQQLLVVAGRESPDTFRSLENQAYTALLLVRAGQLSLDEFQLQLQAMGATS